MRKLVIILFLLSNVVWANPVVEVSTQLNQSADPLPFGKQAELVISLSWPESVDFQPPQAGELQIAEATVTDAFSVDLGSNGLKRMMEYHLQFTRFEPGEFTVGPVLIPTEGEALKTNALKIVFSGSTPKADDTEGDIRAVKSPVEMSTSDFWGLLGKYGLGGLAAILLLSFLVSKSGLLDRFRSPRVRALRQLKRLRKRPPQEPSQLLADTVEVLRSYLAQAYGIAAHTSTSSEIVRELKLDNRSHKIRACAEDLLGFGDKVKFAGREVTLPEAEDQLQQLFVTVGAEGKVPPQ